MTSSPGGFPDAGAWEIRMAADEVDLVQVVPPFDRFYVREYPAWSRWLMP